MREYSDFFLAGMDNPGSTGNFRIVDAIDIWRAQRRAPGLARELPYPAQGYRNPLRAYRRIERAASNAGPNFRPNLIVGKQAHHGSTIPGTSIGVATAELRQPRPDYLLAPAVELSYWHARSGEQATAIGNTVVNQLLAQAAEMTEGEGTAWMVTLNDDEVKSRVLEANDFRIRAGGTFDIDDGVTEYRTLWARPVPQ